MYNLQILNSIAGFFPWGFTKVLVLILCIFYIVFFGIVIRQEKLMSKVIEIPFIPILRILILGNFIAAVFTFLFALIIL